MLSTREWNFARVSKNRHVPCEVINQGRESENVKYDNIFHKIQTSGELGLSQCARYPRDPKPLEAAGK